MEWDKMTDEQKRNCYESYVQEIRSEWGDKADPVSFDEFNDEWTGYVYECL